MHLGMCIDIPVLMSIRTETAVMMFIIISLSTDMDSNRNNTVYFSNKYIHMHDVMNYMKFIGRTISRTSTNRIIISITLLLLGHPIREALTAMDMDS